MPPCFDQVKCHQLWSSKYVQILIWFFQRSLLQKNCLFEVKDFYFTLQFLLFSLAEKQYKELISSLREFAIRRTLLSVANTVQEGKNANVSLTKLLTLPVHGVYINCSVIAFVTKAKANADLPTFSVVQDNSLKYLKEVWKVYFEGVFFASPRPLLLLHQFFQISNWTKISTLY